jgi:hypothetical protein
MIIKPLDRDALRDRVRQATPFPSLCIDGLLDEEFAHRVADAFPTFEQAVTMGRQFAALNERGKVQVTNSSLFPEPIAELNRALAAPEFRETLSYVFEIPDLLDDPRLIGGGMHQTGPQGILDVHVDFNYVADQQLHRRLNILVYFNRDWKPEWGGEVELWDKDVKVRHHAFLPVFNRCVIFATSEISYHGVTAVTCPPGNTRKSFAAYYYTKEAPVGWDGKAHTTIFKARPDEVLKGRVLMPAEKMGHWVRSTLRGAKKLIKSK